MTPCPVAALLTNLRFAYRDVEASDRAVFEDFNLEVSAQRTTAIMGGNGSGKSTLGRLLARRLVPSGGSIVWDDAFRAAKDVVYLDQNPQNAVFPWQTVEENINWPLRQLHWPPPLREERVAHLIQVFNLEQQRRQFPLFLSGGEQQRLAIARCLSWQPKAIIMDEPLAALDATYRSLMWQVLRAAQESDQLTLIVITHLPADVLALAHRCIIFGPHRGELAADFEIPLPFPRDEQSGEYLRIQKRLLEETWRSGVL